jgi:twitching motility protein PilT
MKSHTVLPPWLLGAIESAGGETVILKAGDRPYVMRNSVPYHLGSEPLTSHGLEAIAQQILPQDVHEVLSTSGNVQVTLEQQRFPVLVRAERLDCELIIRLRHVEPAAEDVSGPPMATESVAADTADAPHTITPTATAGRGGETVTDGIPSLSEEARLVAALSAAASTEAVENMMSRLALKLGISTEVAGGSQNTDQRPPARRPDAQIYREVSGTSLAHLALSDSQTLESLTPLRSESVSRAADHEGNSEAAAPPARARTPGSVPNHIDVPAIARPSSTSESIRPERAQRLVDVDAAARSARYGCVAATSDLSDWITEAMERGAATVYLRVGSPPFGRIQGRVEELAAGALPTSMFEHAAAAMMKGADGWQPAVGQWEWTKDFAGVGTVRCHAFADGHGGGFIIHLPVSLATGLEHHVPRHLRTACETGDGLIVISAPFADDVADMVNAVASWNANRRAPYIISFGSGTGLASVVRNGFVSERSLFENDRDTAKAIIGALREQPDVVIVTADGRRVPAPGNIVSAAVGRLVILGVVARTAPRALELLMKDFTDASSRRTLAAVFRAACSWRGFPRVGGKRVVLGDVLVNTERVALLVEAGDIDGLQQAQHSGADGMRALDAVLAGAVVRRTISLREAAASAVDRKLLVTLVRRQYRRRRAARPAG